MDSTLQSLGEILLKAIPTMILLALLAVYLNAIFFKPLQSVLQKRREATEGAKENAEASLKRASERAAEYEAKLQEARAGIYKEHEELRRQWLEEQARENEAARRRTHDLVQSARRQMEQDVEAAKREMAANAEALADQIAASLLTRRAG